MDAIKERSHIIECTKKTLIVLFFLTNVSIMIVDGLPDRSAVGAKFMSYLARYQALAMLYQPWAMFAPNPMNTNAFIEAEVYFSDGTQITFPLPRQQIISGARKILIGDRYRLLAQESLLPQKNEALWFDVSRWVSREVSKQEDSKHHRAISKIIFNRYSNRVLPPPEEPLRPHGTLSSYYSSEPVFYFTPTTEQIRYEAKNNH